MTNVRVFNTKAISISVEMCVGLGLSHSALTCRKVTYRDFVSKFDASNQRIGPRHIAEIMNDTLQ
jgi:hypothetical protein